MNTRTKSEKILIVENDIQASFALRRFIRDYDKTIDVTSCCDCVTAIKLCNRTEFKAVLSTHLTEAVLNGRLLYTILRDLDYQGQLFHLTYDVPPPEARELASAGVYLIKQPLKKNLLIHLLQELYH